MYEVGVGESPMTLYGEMFASRPRERPRTTGVGDQPVSPGHVGAHGDTLGTNQGLHIGESITSPDGNVSLVMQPDGDLVIKKNSDGTVLWHSGTAGKGGVIAWMNWDGNLRVEAPGGESHKLWDNGAHGHKDARARIENGGNLFVWDGSNHQIWDAGASLVHPNPVPGGHGAAHTDFGGIDHDLRNLAHDVEHFGSDLVDDVKQFGPMILSEVQGLISLVPGIGTGISAAIGLAMALLEGGSPIVIAIRTAYGAIPIPPGVRNVTDPIVDGAIHFAENPKDFTDAAITTVRDAVPDGLPREVFDTLIKILIKHQPILKAVGGLVTDVVKQAPGLQKMIDAMPPVASAVTSIRQVAPNGVHIDVAAIPSMVQAAQAQVEAKVDPATLTAIAKQAQQRYEPLHALAVVTSMAQLAHKLGGAQASAAVLAHPTATATTIVHSPPIPPRHPAPPPPAPPAPPHVVPFHYPPHPGPSLSVHPRVVGHPAAAPRAYPPYAHRGAYLPYERHGAYLPYAHHGYPPHAGGRLHGTVGECAPDCKRWGEPVEMDHGMAQVANMLLTARNAPSTVSTGPDGVLYKFERTDAGITARPCLG